MMKLSTALLVAAAPLLARAQDCATQAEQYLLDNPELDLADTCNQMDAINEWTDCPAACTTSLQAAVDTLGCCTPNLLDDELLNPSNLTLVARAFPSVISLCGLKVDGVTGGGCFLSECDLRAADFQATADVSTCQSGEMPGNWSMCDDTCAETLQTAVTELGCCAVDFLETFIDFPNQGYATEAFTKVIDTCVLDVSSLDGGGCAVDACDVEVIKFMDEMVRDVSTCQEGMPGGWTECDATCAATLQSAVDDLDCCSVDFLETFIAGPNQAYADMAFPNVVTVCNLNISTLNIADCSCDLRALAFEVTTAPDTTTCVSDAMPGDWETCDAGCSTAIRSAVDELGCCAVDFLETFIDGPNQEYATMAFPNVLDVCEIDVTTTQSPLNGGGGCAVDACDLMVVDYLADNPLDMSLCPEGMPGFWEMCSPECADQLQPAVEALGCCAVDFLETFIFGPNNAYATMAFPNVVSMCGLDVSSLTAGGCAIDACDLQVIDYVNANMPNVSTCQSFSGDMPMPGFWDMCDETCARSVQAAVDDLGCCAVDFLETFITGPNNEYATMAFPNVVEVCEIERTALNGGGCIVDVCDAQVLDFLAGEDVDDFQSLCPEGMPGSWTECDEPCATAIQSAIDDDRLVCCAVDFLESFVTGPNQDYADMAFPNVVTVCGLNTENLESRCDAAACFSMIDQAEVEELIAGTTCMLTERIDEWTECEESCGADLQTLVDDLGCCAVDLLEGALQYTPEAAAAAFDNIVGLCNIDVSAVEGSCVADASGGGDGPSGASALSTTTATFVLAAFVAFAQQ